MTKLSLELTVRIDSNIFLQSSKLGVTLENAATDSMGRK
jgi:hypothetical protein